MDVVGQYILSCVIIIVLIIIANFFSSCEVSLSSITAGRLKELSEKGNKQAEKLLRLKGRQSDFIAHISMSSIMCIVFATLLGVNTFGKAFDTLLCRLISLISGERITAIHQANHNHSIISAVIILVIILFIAIVLGNTLPKKIVLGDREGFAIKAITLLPFISAVFRPFTYLPIKLANGIARLFSVNPHLDLSQITEEEIRMLMEVGNESGSIENSEFEMINNIFEFNDLTAGEVMTHRTELCAVSLKQSLNEVIELAISEGFSRILVYENDIDNIVGTIYVKDLLAFTAGDKDINSCCVADYMRGVIYAPESANCSMLFREFKEKKIHIAVIVDEYGGTAGIVTMEDLLESIVGNIQDEYDQEETMIEPLGEGCYMLDGGLSVEEMCKLFGIQVEVDEHTETVAGIITNELGYIPEESQHPTVVIGGVELLVTKVEDRRITRVKATKMISKDDEEENK